MSSDAHILQRFIVAQDGCFDAVVHELRAGRKQGHWMWFIFPQIYGLGFSETSKLYAIKSLAEAKAYLDHPILGSRLRHCTDIVIGLCESDPISIFGSVDSLKFRSSMTLFDAASPTEERFGSAIDRYYSAQHDAGTLSLLAD
jgi:uncharacterized protein (DUF1810 family)